MNQQILTRDNPQLSGPTNGAEGVSHFPAIKCIEALPPNVSAFVRDSLALNTRR